MRNRPSLQLTVAATLSVAVMGLFAVSTGSPGAERRTVTASAFAPPVIALTR